MDYGTSIITCFKKYFVFSGRATRSEYWWFYLFTVIVSVTLSAVDGMILGWKNEVDPLSTVFSLAVLIPTLSAASRRLHDIDRSGWWQVMPLVVSMLAVTFFGISIALGGSLEDMMSGIDAVLGGVAIAMFIGSVMLLIIWLATKGTKGPNRYGEDPFEYDY